MRLVESLRATFRNGMTLLWVPDPNNLTLWRVFGVSEDKEISDVTASLGLLLGKNVVQSVCDDSVWLSHMCMNDKCANEELQAIGDDFSVVVYFKAGHVMCASANCLGDADWEGEE
jgi:hypothetical protein